MNSDQYERPGLREHIEQIFTPEQRAKGKFSGGRLFGFKEGWATVLGAFGKAHYFTIDWNYKCDDPNSKAALSLCGRVAGIVNDSAKDSFGMLYGEGSIPRCKNCRPTDAHAR